MENLLEPEAIGQFQTLFSQLQNFILSLFQRWRMYQIGILISLFVLAHVIAFVSTPIMKDWMHGLDGWPKWRLRAVLLVNQRIRAISFVLLAWLCVAILREVTWPSRSYLIALIATLATAWLIVSIGVRLIRNRTARRFVRWGAWIFVTLYILELTTLAASVLDSIALDVGAMHISLLIIIKAAAMLAALMFAAKTLSAAGTKRLKTIDDISPSMRVLSIKALQLTVYGMAVIIAMQSIGFDLTSLAVLSGAIGLGLGFGLQKVVSNLVSGVILLLDKSIKPGDVISLGDTFGWISSLGARYVSVLTRNGTEFLIPNEDLITNRVVNWSHSSDLVRLDIAFGVSYDSDPHAVKKIASAAPLLVERVISTPPPVCHVTGFGDSSIDFILRFWIRDPTGGLTNVRGNVFLALWDALKAENIEIPFPRRDVTLINQAEDHAKS
ncbi:MAG: mechanosensitive ion channel domain-containing protein [Paracoccaceae bacterium]